MENDQDQRGVLVKYSAPSKYCLFPYGQIWQHMGDDNNSTLYIQASINQEEPKWIKMGDFLERVFAARLMNDPLFLENLLAVYSPDISVT